MDLANSTAHTLVLSDRAVKLATDLAPAIGAYWDALHARTDDGLDRTDDGLDSPDFGAACLQMGGVLRSLQAQLLVAAISAEIEPSRKSRRLVRRIQQRLGFWITRLRGLLLLSRFDAEADSLESKRTYFRPIRGLPPREEKTIEGRAFRALRAMQGLDPQALFEAQMGMLAMAGFPDRPFSPQQQRRKRRRRRRSNPGAPTASSRGAERDED